MKKFITFMYMALIGSMALTFVSCKDDKDEPSSGKGVVGKLTINDDEENFFYISGGYVDALNLGAHDYVSTLYSKNGLMTIQMYGVDLNKDYKNGDLIKDITVASYIDGKECIGANEIKSGSIVVDEIDSSFITLKFQNVTLVQSYFNARIKIDGEIKLPIEGELGKML